MMTSKKKVSATGFRLTPSLKKWWRLSVLLLSFALVSCHDDNSDSPAQKEITKTVIMYLPWSGNDIYPYLLKNIRDMESAINGSPGTMADKRLFVFVSESDVQSYLIEVKLNQGKCFRDTLKEYRLPRLNTSAGIASILTDIKAKSPTAHYTMLIGSHGMGWLPVGTYVSSRTARMKAVSAQEGWQQTRFFGHSADEDFQTDIGTLAEAIGKASLHMDYILFDDCYMSNIETAYDLRHVTDYLVASTSEVMIQGIPYSKVGIHLLNGDLGNVCNGFLNFYSNYTTPCGTLAATDCRQLEQMAATMKEINSRFVFDTTELSGLQILDGFSRPMFYDFGDYVDHLCKNADLLSLFREQLNALVVHKVNTPTFYSALNHRQTDIKTFSGLTISDPSTNTSVTSARTQTAWYQATH